MSFEPVRISVAADGSPGVERQGEPVAVGVTFPHGEVVEQPFGLLDAADQSVPVQTTVLERWADQSIRWLLVEFFADLGADSDRFYSLVAGPPKLPSAPLTVTALPAGLSIDTGAATFELPATGALAIAGAHVGGQLVLRDLGVAAADADGESYQFAIRAASIERAGPLSAVVCLDGNLVSPGGASWLDLNMRLQFYAGLGAFRIDVSCTNTRPARHAGGMWDLGDPGSVLIRELSVIARPADRGTGLVAVSIDRDAPLDPGGHTFDVYQDSSGGENWRSPNHHNRLGEVPTTFRGFRAVRNGHEISGLRATPLVSLNEGPSRITLALPVFWEVFPKSLAVRADSCAVGLFPKQFSDVHELQGGERTTFAFVMGVGDDPVSSEPLAWARAPLSVTVDPAVYRRAGAWAPLSVGSPEAQKDYEHLLDTVVVGDAAFHRRREAIDEFGWRNFGEIYADHEAVNEPGLISHYNNQYDAAAGMAMRFMQTGDRRWWSAMRELVAHVSDIDLYHTDHDRAVYNRGYFWHTQHYETAHTATHRAYSRLGKTSGGGPSAEHNYTTGFLLHYCLTGCARSRSAVLQLAEWVIAMDDGRKSRFRWIDRGDTGHASSTKWADYHGPGRGAGNSINALLDAHRLSGDARYLDKAEVLIARCSHPDDDPEALELRDAENRWSYTVFLQALGKYLEHKAERNLIDQRYTYAREVLLNYARWMAQHERPYLERREELEFPNETWAAQDIRKAAVFEFAARYEKDDRQQALLLKRAAEFFDYAVTTLRDAPNGRLVRPLVLLLAYGFQRPMYDTRVSVEAPAVAPVAHQKFVPQRRRVFRRVAWAGAIAITITIATALGLLLL
jgi:hypothetical protein